MINLSYKSNDIFRKIIAIEITLKFSVIKILRLKDTKEERDK